MVVHIGKRTSEVGIKVSKVITSQNKLHEESRNKLLGLAVTVRGRSSEEGACSLLCSGLGRFRVVFLDGARAARVRVRKRTEPEPGEKN